VLLSNSEVYRYSMNSQVNRTDTTRIPRLLELNVEKRIMGWPKIRKDGGKTEDTTECLSIGQYKIETIEEEKDDDDYGDVVCDLNHRCVWHELWAVFF
jgi:hypothetical protein